MSQQGKWIFTGALVLFITGSSGMAQTAVDKIKPRAVSTIQQTEPAQMLQSGNQPAGEIKLVDGEKGASLQANEPVRTTSAVASWDFTTGSDKYYGGATGAKDLGDGNWGMIAGDADGDGQIQIDDNSDYWWQEVGLSGYRTSDYNLNGEVQIDDNADFWWANVGRGTSVP